MPQAGFSAGFWRNSSILFVTIALLKGLRRPSVWALSQLQITYVNGFVKRGLLGQVLYIFNMRSGRAVVAFCFVELVLVVLLLSALTWRSGLLSNTGRPALVAAFAGSYAMTFLAHLVGYQDIALYILAIATVLVADHRARLFVAIPVCMIAPLIHEHFLFSALPVILFSFLVKQDAKHRKAAFQSAASILFVCIVTTVCVSTIGTLSFHQTQLLQEQAPLRALYRIDPGIIAVVGVSTVDNARLNFEVIRHNWWWWAELGVSLLVIGPLLLLLLRTAREIITGTERIAFTIACLAPMLLNFVAWDNVRWMALCALTTYINLALLIRSKPSVQARDSAVLTQQMALVVLALGLASGHGLMDGRKINPFPFLPPYIRGLVIHHDGFQGEVL